MFDILKWNENCKIREKIIKDVYQYDKDHNFIGGYDFFCDYVKDHDEFSIYFLYHPRFINLLWSKYNGKRYKPERFDRIVLDNESDMIYDVFVK